MKHIEIKEVVKMYSDGIATSYTQLINIIAKSDDIEGIKKRIEYLTEFSVVLEFFALKLDINSLIVWQRDTDENLIEILTVKFKVGSKNCFFTPKFRTRTRNILN